MNEKSAAIIIVNWNNFNDTIECVLSLKKIRYDNYKIFLVDNGSTDESFSKLSSLTGDKIELIETGKNLGFSGGNNIAIKRALEEKFAPPLKFNIGNKNTGMSAQRAGFDYILLLNNDTVVEPDFLSELVKAAESDAKIGIAGSKIYFYDEPQKIWYGGGKFTWFGGGRHLQYEKIDENPNDIKVKETEYVTGCSLLIKSDVVRKIGELDERFFLYYEDTDWSLSAREAGYEIIYVPASKVYHKVSRSSVKLGNPIVHYYHIRNALFLSRKHAPFFILIGIYMWSVAHYLKQVIKLVILPSKREISKMIMRGIKDFYKGKFGQYQK